MSGTKFLLLGGSLMTGLIFYWSLAHPFIHVIEFDIRGHTGDEEVRISKNWGLQEILPRTIIGKDWKFIKVVSYGPIINLQIHLLNLNTPPRMITLLSGVVRVRRENILGNLVDRCDWLNIHSQYINHHGKALDETSSTMASIRSGYSGWSGHYNLNGC